MAKVILGQYYKADSLIHKLDPRVKLFGVFVYLILLFASNSVLTLGLCASFLVVCIVLSELPVSRLLKSVKGILYIMFISAFFVLFFTKGEIIWEWGIFTLSKEGINQAIKVCIRFLFIVISSGILTLTTTPNDLTDGMEKAFAPLNKLHFPVHDVAMIMSIAMRFVPILLDETDKIKKAQIARGADFDEGNIIERMRGMIPLIVPLVVSAMSRAVDLATAMESRCYRGGEGRTKFKPLVYKKVDYVAYAVIAMFILGVVLLRIFGF